MSHCPNGSVFVKQQYELGFTQAGFAGVNHELQLD